MIYIDGKLPHTATSTEQLAATPDRLSQTSSKATLQEGESSHGASLQDQDNNEGIAKNSVSTETESEDLSSPETQKVSKEIVTELQMTTFNTHNLEGANIIRKRTIEITRGFSDENLITWDGLADPEKPKNWPSRRKWSATLIVSSFTFITPVSSSIVAPAFNAIGTDLHITSDIELSLTLSIFILAYAIGPLFLGPLSEIYRRVIILQLSSLVFLFFNLACGLASSKDQLVAFRFMAGLGGSAPLALGWRALSDLFTAEKHGKAVSIYSLAPLIGPAIGPIAGGFMVEKVSWRWIFHVVTLVDVLIQVAGLFHLQETCSPVLLGRKNALMKEIGNLQLYTEYDHTNRTIWKTLQIALTCPFMLGMRPIMQVLAIYVAYIFGMMYLILSTFPKLWETQYHGSVGIAGLNYISLGFGFFLGTQICAPLQDRIHRLLNARNDDIGKPEFRVPLSLAGFVLPLFAPDMYEALGYGWGNTLLAGVAIVLGLPILKLQITRRFLLVNV